MDMEQMIADFEEMLGWPYACPGSNDQQGIDCSGAFVRAYRLQGRSLYHGSNRMARTACAWLRPAGQVLPRRGMVAFKARDSQPPQTTMIRNCRRIFTTWDWWYPPRRCG